MKCPTLNIKHGANIVVRGPAGPPMHPPQDSMSGVPKCSQECPLSDKRCSQEKIWDQLPNLHKNKMAANNLPENQIFQYLCSKLRYLITVKGYTRVFRHGEFKSMYFSISFSLYSPLICIKTKWPPII